MTTDLKSQGKQAQGEITSWASKDGEFRRLPSVFRSHVEVGGRFPPEKGRYLLYVSYGVSLALRASNFPASDFVLGQTACPWAHRTLITRKLKGLEEFIDVWVRFGKTDRRRR